MSEFQLAYYFKQQCKFRLKNGKEVYGVIWADDKGFETQYYFASASEHGLYEEALERNDTAAIQKLIHPVDPEQIIGAERIAC